MVPPLIHSALHSAGEKRAVWNCPLAFACAARVGDCSPLSACVVHHTVSSNEYLADALREVDPWRRAKEGTRVSTTPVSTTRARVRAEKIRKRWEVCSVPRGHACDNAMPAPSAPSSDDAIASFDWQSSPQLKVGNGESTNTARCISFPSMRTAEIRNNGPLGSSPLPAALNAVCRPPLSTGSSVGGGSDDGPPASATDGSATSSSVRIMRVWLCVPFNNPSTTLQKPIYKLS